MERPTPIDVEYTFDDSVIMSETNLNGIITFVNRKFCEVSGYDREELKGANHNAIRHPDMPRAFFKAMWAQIQQGKEWNGVIKNLRSDGKYYWVHSHISPIVRDGVMVGYAAARRAATKLEIEEALEEYEKLSKQ
jgi:PAS domain S-box-containing protein